MVVLGTFGHGGTDDDEHDRVEGGTDKLEEDADDTTRDGNGDIIAITDGGDGLDDPPEGVKEGFDAAVGIWSFDGVDDEGAAQGDEDQGLKKLNETAFFQKLGSGVGHDLIIQ